MGRSYRDEPTLATVSGVNLDLLAELAEEESPLDLVARMGAQMLLEAALEEEVAQALGRARYQRRSDEQVGYRNGHRSRKLTSGVGELDVDVPRVDGLPEPFSSNVLPARQRILDRVQELFPGLYAEGLSTRDFQRALGPSLGQAGLSKSSVSRTCQRLKEGFESWRLRSLADEDVVYLFLDGFYLGVRRGSKEKEGILLAHGINAAGKRVLLGVWLGWRESTAAWKSCLDDLVGRGLQPPRLVICDGNPGLLRAVGETWPESGLQRCIAHRMRNILSRVPKKRHDEVKRALRAIFYAADESQARQMAERFREQFEAALGAATACLLAELDACLTFYRFPAEHWRRLRTSNIIERSIKEVRRRTNVVGRFPTEQSAVNLVWATLIDDALKWRGLPMTEPLLERIEAAVIELPKSMWAVNNMGQERLAA